MNKKLYKKINYAIDAGIKAKSKKKNAKFN